MLETYKGVVYPWECDFFGHLNVRYYTSKFDEATWQLKGHFGFSPAYFKTSQTGLFTVEQHIKYKKELLPGDLFVMKSELLSVDSKTIQYRHVLINSETEEIAAEMTLTDVYVDMHSRKSKKFPLEIYNVLIAGML